MQTNIQNRTVFTGTAERDTDCLEVMRGMDSQSVDLVYLDPPFNSKKQWDAPLGSAAAGAGFKDRWNYDDIKEEWFRQIKAENPALYSVVDAVGKTGGKPDKSYLCYMAVRLMEMKRVLKDTGSIYLHCDTTMSHALKLAMDAVFGAGNFRNEIVWKRATGQKGSQHDPKQWGKNRDAILFYAKSATVTCRPYRELTTEEAADGFPHVDKKGERYKDDSAHVFRSPGLGPRPNLCYTWRGFTAPHPSGWRLSKERLEEEYKKGNIVIEGGKVKRRLYLRDYKGKPVGNLWDDVPPVDGKERTGYPTQKPIALLKRIIAASSNKGDVVLDPFCGCGTTLDAAEALGRQWIGIDASALAARVLINNRPTLMDIRGKIVVRTDFPKRTEADKKFQLVAEMDDKDLLYGKQGGICAGCGVSFHKRNMTKDHIIPKSRGGQDGIDNLQLLCAACNSMKGNRLTTEELRAKLREQGII